MTHKKKIVMIVAPRNYRDEEYFKPRVVLMSHGIDIATASSEGEEATGMLGGKAKIDVLVSQIHSQDFDGLILVGGSGAQDYFKNQTVRRLVQEFADEHKTVGAICIAPTILAFAGLLKGKKATCFSSEEKQLKASGACLINQGVVVDGRIVTARGPEYAQEFGESFAAVLNRK